MATLLALTCLLAAALAAPRGKYCANYDGIVSGVVTVTTSTTFDLSLNFLGDDHSCPNEAYQYFPANNSFVVPGLQDPTDCVGQYAIAFGLTVSVSYYKDSNSFSLLLNGNLQVNSTNC
jgi:hypothetical protein